MGELPLLYLHTIPVSLPNEMDGRATELLLSYRNITPQSRMDDIQV
jgi:hypothetical protein